jgi:hypothetical protein
MLALGSSARAWAGPPEGPSPAVVLLSFTGDEWHAGEQREHIREALEARGHDVHPVAISVSDMAAHAGCQPSDAACLVEVGRVLADELSVTIDYVVWADLPHDGAGEVSVFDVASGRVVVDLDLEMSGEDLILPAILGDVVARRVQELREPPAPPSEAELEQLAMLDHTPGPVREWPPPSPPRPPHPTEPLYPPAIDLRRDFADWCRVTPRDDARYEGPDLRPVCKLGPTFGYFRPRTWTMLSLTAGATVGTGVLYGLAFGAASSWSPPTTERLEIGAHVMLASTVVLGSVLAIVIASDRRQAKRFLDRLNAETSL